MPISRSNRVHPGETFVFFQSGLTGDLAAVNIGEGVIPIGLYHASVNIRINANVGSSTFTGVSLGTLNLLTAAGFSTRSGAVAAATQHTFNGLVYIATASPQVSVTTTSSPQYDVTVVLTRISDLA